MATEPSTSGNNQTGDPKSAEPIPREENEPKQRTWQGAVRKDKLWCDCEPACRASCKQSKQPHSKGKKFWSCPKKQSDPANCQFYLWDDEREEAMAWLRMHGPPDPYASETPVKGRTSSERETPWTKAKKKPLSREASDQERAGESSEKRADDGFVFVEDNEDGGESPSRKGGKRKRVESTDGEGEGRMTFVDRLRAAALPTPETMEKGKGKAKEVKPAPNESPSLSKNAANQALLKIQSMSEPSVEGLSLTSKILRLLHEEKIEIKESTELQIQHEIELESDVNAAAKKKYEETISKMGKRIDELESMVEHLTGDGEGSLCEPIYLSD